MSGYLKTKAIELIEAHYRSSYEPDEFNKHALNVAKYFDNKGDYELAEYIEMLVNGDDGFVPMDKQTLDH